MDTAALDGAILRTLVYFSLFQYPLTLFEIWKWLMVPTGIGEVSYARVVRRLEESEFLRRHVAAHQGFFSVGEVASFVRERASRLHDAVRKYERLTPILRILSRIPWIEGIAVCNSLAWQHTRPDSDIDLFIVTTPGRTWSARLLATLPLRLLGLRPGEAKQDPICVSFFAAPTRFDFAQLKIGEHDPYLAYWCRSLVPLLDRTGWFADFRAKNIWLEQLLPNAGGVCRAIRFRPPKLLRLPWVPVSEKLAKAAQIERFPRAIRELMNRDTRVVVNDDMLKFHHNDARAEIAARLEARLQKLNVV